MLFALTAQAQHLTYGEAAFRHDVASRPAGGGGVVWSYPAGAVGVWHMNDNWNDSTINANNGIAYNGATFSSAAKFGAACGSFGGSGYVQTSSGLPISTACTFSVWVNAASWIDSLVYPTAIGVGDNQSCSFWVGGAYSLYSFGLLMHDASFSTWAVIYATNSFSAASDAGVWRHLVITYDANASPVGHVYKDGVELSTYHNQTAHSLSGMSFVSFGRDAADGYYWPGLMDEVAIFNRALASNEVHDLYVNDAGVYGAVAPDIVTTGGYMVATFTNSSIPGILTLGSTKSCDILCIGGGGGGGDGLGTASGQIAGGAGGGGGYIYTNITLAAGTYYAQVGGGGFGQVDGGVAQTSGRSSTFNGLTAYGGGYGGSYNEGDVGGSGGSGGGGVYYAAGGAGTTGQGYAGGHGPGDHSVWPGGGGGGAFTNGQDGVAGSIGANGGGGITNSISGSPQGYAGGGGGGVVGGTAGTANCGGGNGSADTSTAASGSPNTGGGGGGGGGSNGGSGNGNGGNGGNGVVVVRYVP